MFILHLYFWQKVSFPPLSKRVVVIFYYSDMGEDCYIVTYYKKKTLNDYNDYNGYNDYRDRERDRDIEGDLVT